MVTDEVAFDFMEQMAPGCTALIPAELSMQLVRGPRFFRQQSSSVAYPTSMHGSKLNYYHGPYCLNGGHLSLPKNTVQHK